MTVGHLPNWDLRMLLRAASGELLSNDWLIVALDSARGDKLHQSYEFLKGRLSEKAKWTKSGIRIPGRDLAEADIVVPFTAAFVLKPDTPEPIAPYNATSESDTFQTGLPLELETNVKTPGILAYVADGCGLNYWCIDASLCECLYQTEK